MITQDAVEGLEVCFFGGKLDLMRSESESRQCKCIIVAKHWSFSNETYMICIYLYILYVCVISALCDRSSRDK